MHGSEQRALLNWSAEELARKARLGVATVRRGETAEGEPTMTTADLAAIQRAPESAGVEFTNGGRPGVRLGPPAVVDGANEHGA